jgi:ABC-type Zn2+ transport system substrate-binding protein/surface adhesin
MLSQFHAAAEVCSTGDHIWALVANADAVAAAAAEELPRARSAAAARNAERLEEMLVSLARAPSPRNPYLS